MDYLGNLPTPVQAQEQVVSLSKPLAKPKKNTVRSALPDLVTQLTGKDLPPILSQIDHLKKIKLLEFGRYDNAQQSFMWENDFSFIFVCLFSLHTLLYPFSFFFLLIFFRSTSLI